jgi:hypothetical protein
VLEEVVEEVVRLPVQVVVVRRVHLFSEGLEVEEQN